YQAALARLLEAASYDRLRREQASARAQGRYLGIGLSCFIELTGPGAQFYGVGGAPISGQEGTTVRLEPGGAVTALVGVTNQGQGPSPTERTSPSSRWTWTRARSACCATSPSTTAAGSSIPRSWRVRSRAASPRVWAAPSPSTASTTRRASS